MVAHSAAGSSYASSSKASSKSSAFKLPGSDPAYHGDDGDHLYERHSSFENGIFGVLFTLSKENSEVRIRLRWLLLKMALDAWQLFTTIIAPEQGWNIDANGTGWKVVAVLNFGWLADLGYGAYLAVLYCMLAALMVNVGMCVWVAWCFKEQKFPVVWPIKVLRVFSGVFFQAFDVASLNLLQLGLSCRYSGPEEPHMAFDLFPQYSEYATVYGGYSEYATVYGGVEVNPLSRRPLALGHSGAEVAAFTIKDGELLPAGHGTDRSDAWAARLTTALLAGLAPALAAGGLASWAALRRTTRAALAALANADPGTRLEHVLADVVDSPRDVEVVARCCRVWVDRYQLDPEAVNAAHRVIQAGLAMFPKSPFMVLLNANFMIEVLGVSTSGGRRIQDAKKLNPGLMCRFIMFVRHQQASQKAAGNNTSDGASMDLLGYVEYQRKQRMVVRLHREALQAMCNFWRALDSSSVSFTQLSKALGKIESSVHATEFFERAERLEELKHGDASGPLLPDGTPLGRMDEINTAVLVVNTTGEMQMANRQAHQLFGYKRGTLDGKPLATLLAPHCARWLSSKLADLSSTAVHPSSVASGAGGATTVGPEAAAAAAAGTPPEWRRSGGARVPAVGGPMSALASVTSSVASVVEAAELEVAAAEADGPGHHYPHHEATLVGMHADRLAFPVKVTLSKVSGVGEDSTLIAMVEPIPPVKNLSSLWVTNTGLVAACDPQFALLFGWTASEVVGTNIAAVLALQDYDAQQPGGARGSLRHSGGAALPAAASHPHLHPDEVQSAGQTGHGIVKRLLVVARMGTAAANAAAAAAGRGAAADAALATVAAAHAHAHPHAHHPAGLACFVAHKYDHMPIACSIRLSSHETGTAAVHEVRVRLVAADPPQVLVVSGRGSIVHASPDLTAALRDFGSLLNSRHRLGMGLGIGAAQCAALTAAGGAAADADAAAAGLAAAHAVLQTADALEGYSFFDFLPPPWRDMHTKFLRDTTTMSPPGRGALSCRRGSHPPQPGPTLELRTANGRPLHMHVAVATSDVDGEQLHVVHMARSSLEAGLAERRLRLRVSPEGVVSAVVDGSPRHLFGLEAAQLVGRGLRDLVEGLPLPGLGLELGRAEDGEGEAEEEAGRQAGPAVLRALVSWALSQPDASWRVQLLPPPPRPAAGAAMSSRLTGAAAAHAAARSGGGPKPAILQVDFGHGPASAATAGGGGNGGNGGNGGYDGDDEPPVSDLGTVAEECLHVFVDLWPLPCVSGLLELDPSGLVTGLLEGGLRPAGLLFGLPPGQLQGMRLSELVSLPPGRSRPGELLSLHGDKKSSLKTDRRELTVKVGPVHVLEGVHADGRPLSLDVQVVGKPGRDQPTIAILRPHAAPMVPGSAAGRRAVLTGPAPPSASRTAAAPAPTRATSTAAAPAAARVAPRACASLAAPPSSLSGNEGAATVSQPLRIVNATALAAAAAGVGGAPAGTSTQDMSQPISTSGLFLSLPPGGGFGPAAGDAGNLYGGYVNQPSYMSYGRVSTPPGRTMSRPTISPDSVSLQMPFRPSDPGLPYRPSAGGGGGGAATGSRRPMDLPTPMLVLDPTTAPSPRQMSLTSAVNATYPANANAAGVDASVRGGRAAALVARSKLAGLVRSLDGTAAAASEPLESALIGRAASTSRGLAAGSRQGSHERMQMPVGGTNGSRLRYIEGQSAERRRTRADSECGNGNGNGLYDAESDSESGDSGRDLQVQRRFRTHALLTVALLAVVHVVFFALMLTSIHSQRESMLQLGHSGQSQRYMHEIMMDLRSLDIIATNRSLPNLYTEADVPELLSHISGGAEVVKVWDGNAADGNDVFINVTVWDFVTRFYTMARLVEQQWPQWRAAGVRVADTMPGQFLLKSGPDLFRVSRKVFDALLYKAVDSSRKVDTLQLVFLAVEGAFVTCLAAGYLAYLLRAVAAQRHKLFRIFLAIPVGLTRALASQNTALLVEAKIRGLLSFGRSSRAVNPLSPSASLAIIGMGAAGAASAAAGSYPGSAGSGRRTLRANNNDTLIVLSPFITWSVLVIVFYSIAVVKMRVFYAQVGDWVSSGGVAGYTLQLGVEASDSAGPETEIFPLVVNGIAYDSPELTNLFYGNDVCHRQQEHLPCPGPSYRFHRIVHTGVDSMVQQFLISLHAMAFNTSDVPEGLGDEHFDFVYNVGAKDLLDGTVLIGNAHYSRILAVFDDILIFHIVLFLLLFANFAAFLFFLLNPLLTRISKERRQIAELMSQLPLELDVERLVARALATAAKAATTGAPAGGGAGGGSRAAGGGGGTAPGGVSGGSGRAAAGGGGGGGAGERTAIDGADLGCDAAAVADATNKWKAIIRAASSLTGKNPHGGGGSVHGGGGAAAHGGGGGSHGGSVSRRRSSLLGHH
ncbi:hypothetical protein GPECTOR_73g623 [Gonium pectorale]|uniref:PAS domain-containing protein n=1 Tax=Gonium pectorale TaxID=33097 RepID=A0A150G2K7_GONPE|nr:hypothetical protein GPECTOR_73g623 [Gonium pectorale]|eukprot:KXZ44102.1 hypothetical protein GPECTOR_73g623 [Gonium pectorale]